MPLAKELKDISSDVGRYGACIGFNNFLTGSATILALAESVYQNSNNEEVYKLHKLL